MWVDDSVGTCRGRTRAGTKLERLGGVGSNGNGRWVGGCNATTSARSDACGYGSNDSTRSTLPIVDRSGPQCPSLCAGSPTIASAKLTMFRLSKEGKKVEEEGLQVNHQQPEWGAQPHRTPRKHPKLAPKQELPYARNYASGQKARRRARNAPRARAHTTTGTTTRSAAPPAPYPAPIHTYTTPHERVGRVMCTRE